MPQRYDECDMRGAPMMLLSASIMLICFYYAYKEVAKRCDAAMRYFFASAICFVIRFTTSDEAITQRCFGADASA